VSAGQDCEGTLSLMRLPRTSLCCLTVTLGLLTACAASGNGPLRTPAAVAERTPHPHASVGPAETPKAKPRVHEKELPARFYGAVLPFTPAFARQLRNTTWHRGCPLPLRDLRLLTLRYWGFDHRVHQGLMEINVSAAHDVVTVFRKLFRARFPIKDMQLAHRYVPGPINPRSRADITDGFNCRPVVTARGAAPRWSMHAYGLAIDINQLQNPYVTGTGHVDDVYARRYRNRSLHLPGMIHAGDVVVRAFASIGWHWGGSWTGDKDYMHFSLNGH
jgi:D-alanyl-D-alanine carboxypeptidase-like protein